MSLQSSFFNALRKQISLLYCLFLIFLFLSLKEKQLFAFSIDLFSTPTIDSQPIIMTPGPDGNLWFTEEAGNNIAKITPSGVISEFPVPTPNSNPLGITTGPNGNLWFVEQLGNNIGEITTAGVITREIPIPTPNSLPIDITAGPDGNLWFTEGLGNNIGQITTAGVITNQFPVPTPNSLPAVITVGPDKNLWFTQEFGNNIGQITTAGVITEFPLPTPGSFPIGVTGGFRTGPDGNLWFTEGMGNKIGRLNLIDYTITEFPIPTSDSLPTGIEAGPDGNLWFGENNANQIGRISPEGVISEFPALADGPVYPAVGSDGNVWFTFPGNIFSPTLNNKIGRINLPQLSVSNEEYQQPLQGCEEHLVAVTISGERVSPEDILRVAYRTENGTALAGLDYLQTEGLVIFPPNETSQTIAITVCDGGSFGSTSSKDFAIIFSHPHNISLGSQVSIKTVTVTILNNGAKVGGGCSLQKGNLENRIEGKYLFLSFMSGMGLFYLSKKKFGLLTKKS